MDYEMKTTSSQKINKAKEKADKERQTFLAEVERKIKRAHTEMKLKVKKVHSKAGTIVKKQQIEMKKAISKA